ncbi:hypothetical protein OAA61_03305 [Candidatus Pelagibacter ubique]|nr:hypothetical protein [Candidatus Pelagibacter ubique]
MYIHIGLGKCNTTFLQNNIFPKISKVIGFNYVYKDLIKKFNYLEYIAHPLEKKSIKFKTKNFISCEILSGDLFYNPHYYKKACIINSRIFSKKSKIIITLREPKSFIRSVYSEVLSNGFAITQKKYFISKKNLIKNQKYFFDFKKLSYENLIKFYSDRFETVYIVKMEDTKNLKLWSKIFNNNKILNIKYEDEYINKSLSSISLMAIFFYNQVLDFFKIKQEYNHKRIVRNTLEKLVIKFGLYRNITISKNILNAVEKSNSKFYLHLKSGRYTKKN